jgi:hypothetical protein
MVVDFPAPFGPRNPVTLPAGTVKERWSTARTPSKMTADWFVLTLAVATALRGLGAGTIAGLSMMDPVRGRLRLLAYAQITRAVYRGNGVRTYGAGTILGALLTDDDEPRMARLLDTWERWHIVGAVSHVAAFISLVVALAYV